MDRLRLQVESIQWQVSKQALQLGVDVILKNGFWSTSERNSCRQKAEALGAGVKLCFLDVPLEILWDRLSRRNSNLPADSFHVTKTDLEKWATWFEPPGDGEQFQRFS